MNKAMCARLVILALFSASPFLAAEIHVTNLADSGGGSLRQAIAGATSGDTIVFEVTGTITLSSGELVINKNLTISGPGASRLVISGDHSSRVFYISTGSTAAIVGVTIRNGSGIFNDGGALTVTDCTFSGNSASGLWNAGAGVIYNFGGVLSVGNSTLAGNYASDGGAIGNYGGTATVTNSVLTDNSGGGIYNYYFSTLTVTNSTVSGNSGNGIYNYYYATLTLTNSTVSGNSANVNGAGIYNVFHATATVTKSTISGNSAQYGGGIFNARGEVTLINSTISGNSAQYCGGGIFNARGNETSGYGGAVNVTNSTLFGNSANTGGAICNRPVLGRNTTLTLKGSILANSPSGGNCFGYSTIASRGHNLSDDGTCAAFFTQPSDFNNIPPGLDPGGLKDNGGSTKTIALLATSPAVDAIPVSDCNDLAGNPVTTDQRGVARPQGRACDIGALERVLNQLPVANAGVDQTGIVNVPLTFHGSASLDPDGTIVSYQWNFGDGSPTATGATVRHAYSMAGIHTATLTVTDNGGAAASDTAVVTIQSAAQATQTLIRTVQALGLPRGREQSFVAKLQAALAAMTRNDRLAKLAALNQLQAFIYEVSALQGVVLTPQQAVNLATAAQQIMQSLSTSP